MKLQKFNVPHIILCVKDSIRYNSTINDTVIEIQIH